MGEISLDEAGDAGAEAAGDGAVRARARLWRGRGATSLVGEAACPLLTESSAEAVLDMVFSLRCIAVAALSGARGCGRAAALAGWRAARNMREGGCACAGGAAGVHRLHRGEQDGGPGGPGGGVRPARAGAARPVARRQHAWLAQGSPCSAICGGEHASLDSQAPANDGVC